MVVKTKKESVKESVPLEVTGWKYFWNDQQVDEETYERLCNEHLQRIKEEEERDAAAEAARQLEDKPKRKKK